jgi:hypothetical protein
MVQLGDLSSLNQFQKIMKFQFQALLSVICLLALNSCASRLQINPYTGQARLVPANGGYQQGPPQGYQGGWYGGNNNGYGSGQTQKRLIGKQAVTVKSGYVQAQVMADPSNRTRVAQWAESYRRQNNGRMPSDEEVSSHFGFPCQVRFVDTSDMQVSSRFIRG